MTRRVYSVSDIQRIVAPIAEKHRVERVYLFGSYARHEATEESDVDLCAYAPLLRSLFAWGGFYADLENGLGKKLDLVMEDGIQEERFRKSFERDKVLIYGRV